MFSEMLDRYLAKLNTAESTEDISSLIGSFLSQYDLSMFSAVLVKNAQLETIDDIVWMSNTTDAHFEEYNATNRIRDDYGIRKHTTENLISPFLIGSEFMSETPDIKNNEIDFYKFNESQGYRSGLVVPLKTQISGLPTGYSLWSGLSKAQFDLLVSSHLNEIILFLLLAQRKVESALSVLAYDLEPLTNRERECLSLVARGLRPEQIGDQLCIATVTANYHIRMIRKKLSARTNAEAVAKAISCNLI